MTIYERIKQRRKELGLSAEDVAKALNVSRATVYRYESSYIEKVPITVIEPLAKVLKCTPAYIMGLEPLEKENVDIVHRPHMLCSQFEERIILAYRQSDDLTKAMVLRALNLEQSHTEARAGAKDILA